MRLDPDARFEAFAAREPYFAVLTASKFLRENLTPEHHREFFDSGQELVDWMFTVIEQHVAPRFSPMTMLEYGCGVGRLALPLARRPGSVVAVDRSPAMLDVAREEAARAGGVPVQFQAAPEFFASERKFDFIACVHVLQRLDERDGHELMRRLIDRLATGGIAVFHVPFRSAASGAVRATRWARERVPVLDEVSNRLRGKPDGLPLIPSHLYDLAAVFEMLDELGLPAAHIEFEHEQELSSAVVFAELPLPSITGVDGRGRPLPGRTLRTRSAGETVDVKRVIETTSIDELNRAAEQYFASIADTDDQLAKPFSNLSDTPRILSNLSSLLHGLKLRTGLRVLEFGAGAGWLARSLTQLGCEVMLLDVSPTALRLARELYTRLPVIGDRPPPHFLEFDGRRIPVDDASVDRIVSFDAFHHVPNPDDMLREMGRILRPGGIAGFAEPGARHSDTPMSQFEMRTYQVVENDIDIHGVWRTARECGFRDMRLAIFNGPPFYVSLPEYEDFLAAGQTSERWLTATRVFQRDTRHFFLVKAGEERLDSRAADALACAIAVTSAPASSAAERPTTIHATVTNTGKAEWLPADVDNGGVQLGAHLYDEGGALLDFDLYADPLTDPPRIIAPGETVAATLTVPPLAPGRYRLELDCVASRVAWFAQVGSKPVTVQLKID